MTVRLARVIRASEVTRATPLLAPGPSAVQRRRFAREELEGRLAAERVVEEAGARASAMLAEAAQQAAGAASEAQRVAREEEQTKLAAQWVALRKAEGEGLERETERVVTLAVLLAERLLGAALELQPGCIAGIARGVLAEARGVRRAVIDAHPLDAAALRQSLSAAGGDLPPMDIREDEALARGALRLHTDLGIIDAQLAPRLERLAAALRDALR